MTPRRSASPARVGLYAWGGPGTIRLLQTKYFQPKIDQPSFLRLYDPPFLDWAAETLGVTDMWVTYSWGFSDQREAEDRQFLSKRLPNFAQRQIHTHAYVQGLNVVTEDFANQPDLFCRGPRGKRLPYSRGRSLICPNSPATQALTQKRVAAAARTDASGVFIDNILFGLPPLAIWQDATPFFGCSCTFCQQRWQQQFGEKLPLGAKFGPDLLRAYLQFRTDSVRDWLQPLAEIVHQQGKEFSVNFYDPYWHTPEIYFGYRAEDLIALVDLVLIENHHLPSSSHRDNAHLQPLLKTAGKPVFVVSYDHGIGLDAMYTQNDLNAIWSEAHALGYQPCLKATEFVTNGAWHALHPQSFEAPTISPWQTHSPSHQTLSLPNASPLQRASLSARSAVIAPFASWSAEHLNPTAWYSQWFSRQMQDFHRYRL